MFDGKHHRQHMLAMARAASKKIIPQLKISPPIPGRSPRQKTVHTNSLVPLWAKAIPNRHATTKHPN
jgi:hypothetical protein